MALYVILAVGFLGIFHKSDCQTVSMEAPNDVMLGTDMTITCKFTDVMGNPNTVPSVQWTYTGATGFTVVVSPTCSVFGPLPSAYSGMSITPSCGTHEYSLVFASVVQTTVDNNWCCNVVLNPGPSPSVESCDRPMLQCGDPTKPANGQVTFTNTTYQSTATYSCNSDYTLIRTATTTCQADGIWSGPVPICTACQVGCFSGLIIASMHGLSWIFASIVVLIIYKIDKTLLPWTLSDGNLKKWQIWLLLFICVPYVPSAVAIYLFKTKRPLKRTVGTELDKNGTP